MMGNVGRVFMLAAWIALCAIPGRSIAEEAGDDYKLVPDWPNFAENEPLGEVAGVGVDSHNHVFIFHRGDVKPIRNVDAKTGKIINAWGEGMFVNAHGLDIDSEDNIWVTDTRNHQIFKFSHDGKLLMTLGEKGVSGIDGNHFDQPTDVTVAPSGEFYVSDGYGNNRVAKFAADGKFLFDWGGREKGDGPGEFFLPHGITLDDEGRVYVADRSNLRIQIFDPNGKFLHQWSEKWPGRPWGLEVADDGFIYVIDGGNMSPPDVAQALKLDLEGNVVARWGSFGDNAGQFSWGHDIAVGRDGAVYIVEVRINYRVQKFVEK